ncbi:MAG: insulinase family protein [Kiritimatiellae bacterium]|nr:insulinase family protein [Kiritimatiellia bacterium]
MGASAIHGAVAAAAAATAFAAAGAPGVSPAFAPGDTLCGFRVVSVCELPDVEGRLVRMVYEKNGAELAWLSRDDENMTFAIAFQTLPGDDTGVAHILEHSVLCGSRKYPVKEPFVELLKSSFATFLNAWTAPDHTAYPVASRNRADFLNLMDVYLDAVFHPLSVETPTAFEQEGWHWQLDSADGELSRNGIVYSEMKGAFSKPETVAACELDRLLYPDNAYRFVSGGDPQSIPSLTFDAYREFYRRNYHPSNAKVFLDGKVDVPAALALLDSYFREYDRRERAAPAPLQTPRPASKTVKYDIAAGEDPSGKTILAEGWIAARFDEVEKRTALSILASAIAGSNEEPLSKALLGRGLCEDVTMSCGGCLQTHAAILVENAKDGATEEIRRVTSETLAALAKNGLDHERLLSLIAREEFEYRESDFGTFPRGLAYFSGAMDLWLYGGDPADAFRMNGVYASLRRRVAEGWFERLLQETFVDNHARVSLVMEPVAGLTERRAEEERARLAALKASWTEDERRRVAALSVGLKERQAAPDSPEDLAKLPRVGVKDIPAEGNAPEFTSKALASGATLYRAKTQAKGIVYAYLAFPLDGLTGEEMADAAFAAYLLGELATAKRDAGDLKKAVDADMGRFTVSVAPYSQMPSGGRPGRGRAYMEVRAGALTDNADRMAALVREILTETNFDDPARVGDLLTQKRRGMELSANGMGARHLARGRALASVSESGAIDDWMGGIAALRRMQALDASFAKDGAETCRRLGALMKRIVSGGASAAVISGEFPEGWDERFLDGYRLDEAADRTPRVAPFPARREAFTCAGAVASAAKAAFTPDCTGAGIVASRVLSLEHLWTEIRVKGGAYGGGFTRTYSGQSSFLSWNDPSPMRSLGVYDASADALRKAAAGDCEKYIVSALASFEPYLTPPGEMARVMGLVLSGRTAEDFRRMRREIVATGREDLLRFAEELEKMRSSKSVCVVGGKAIIDAAGAGAFDAVEEIAK